MSDSAAPITDFAVRQVSRKDSARAELDALKRAVIPPLRGAGVAAVEIVFDGYGDSGAIEEITCRDAQKKVVDCPPTELSGITACGSLGSGKPPATISDALEEIAYLALELRHPGWENNEGAGGSLEIDVANASFILDCKLRYVDYDEYLTDI